MNQWTFLSVYDSLIRMATIEGDLVFDPMCGSGTTGAVCKKLNRHSVLADEKQEYIEISKARINTLKI